MKLFYKQYGEQGPALFILHGIFGMLDNWHNIAKHLSSQYRVYTIDARNHGQSPHDEDMSYELMANDVIELANDLHLDQFILMGHSMGGKTAMHLTLSYPQRVQKLIVVDIAPKAYAPGHKTYFEAFKSINWSLLDTRKAIDEALTNYESNMGVRLFLAKNIDRSSTGGFEIKCNISAIEKAYEHIIGSFDLNGQYNGPSLFLCGANSKYLNESDKPNIKAHFSAAQFDYVSHAGHWVHADNPAEFLQKLNQFLG